MKPDSQIRFQFKYGDRVRVADQHHDEREGEIRENYPLQLEPCYNVRYPDGTYSVHVPETMIHKL